MGIFDGDIVHGSIRNGPCTIHLNLAHIFCLLILETQRLTALRDPFGDFRVPSVDFFIELCRFLRRREHSAAKAGWFQLGILQSCCAKDRCHLAYQCETHIERSS